MTGHALLSPSAAHRWIACPASVNMAAKVIETHGEVETGYALEGTRAHTLAEIEAARHFELIDIDTFNERIDKFQAHTPSVFWEDMEKYAGLYVDFLQEIIEGIQSPQTILLEQRIDTGIEFCWGTGDAVIVAPNCLHVVDYKYGQGVEVSAVGNPQLRLYGVGALEMFGILGETETVTMHIFQPRLGQRSSETLTAEELRAWRDEVVEPRAIEALGEHASFGPSIDACRFCPAAGECKPRMLHMTAMDFGDPDIMTPTELADSVRRLEELRDWCNAIEATALFKAYSKGVQLPGLKVVMSGGRRDIPDKELAIKTLRAAGFRLKDVARPVLYGLGELEKRVGKKELPEILGDLLVKGHGKPSLAPEDDPRPPADPEEDAKREFS